MSAALSPTLAAEIATVRAHLEGGSEPDAGARPAMAGGARDGDGDPTVAAVCRLFGLSAFERALLVLCAAAELDPSTSRALAAGGGPGFPTFAVALAALPGAHWSAVAPSGPLRHWQLVEPEAGPSLLGARLRLDERVLHLLAGVSYLDPRVAAIGHELDVPRALPPGHAGVAERLAIELDQAARLRVELVGGALGAASAIAATAAARTGRRAFAVAARELPGTAAQRPSLQRLLEREAVLGGLVLVLDADGDDGARDAAARFLSGLEVGCVVVGREPLVGLTDAIRMDVPAVSALERRALWREALGPGWTGALNGSLDAMAAQFDLDMTTIAAAGREAETNPVGEPADRLWAACRRRSRPRLDDLAERIESTAAWDDLVLPEDALTTLRQLVAQVRWRSRVYEDWGFAERGSRGLGIGAMFAGPSGTGKTMAAEIVANQLRLDLFRIDLSSVVSKYIGETEKNLRRVFDAADRVNAVLLFDEADALFGRRTEVRDSHDRYANIEVSYLLQRMEAYRGLAILTTNRRDALDDAFLRRIRFVVDFPFPAAAQRREIWQRVFPDRVPRESLDLEALAGLTVAGGNIRNIALGAAFLAADDAVPVGMEHLRQAARTEYAKLERPRSSVELS